jgi:putative transposase
MQLVEQHIIARSDSRFASIDAAAFSAKNLYNAANFLLRQAYIFNGQYLSCRELQRQMRRHDAYRALPVKVAQQVLRLLDKNWQTFLEARLAYQADPGQCAARPRLPKYKHKTDGRVILVYTLQALSKTGLKRGLIQPSRLPITVQTNQASLSQVRVVQRVNCYVVEVMYERQEQLAQGDPALVAGVDIGVDNLAAIASNKAGFIPHLVNGRPAKSINQFYNQRRTELQDALPEPEVTKRLERLTTQRERRLNQYLHAASKRIIALLVQEGIGTLVIGNSPLWKPDAQAGRYTSRHFEQLPFARFAEMLRYKAQLAGIRVLLTEESYTSQCSFLDQEPIGKHERYAGRRLKRGLFRTAGGQYLNADVNGAYNIIRKAVPEAFCQGIEAVVVQPVRLAV